MALPAHIPEGSLEPGRFLEGLHQLGLAHRRGIEFDETTSARFQIPIPDKGDALIILPLAIDVDDWTMVKAMLEAYVNRLMKTVKVA